MKIITNSCITNRVATYCTNKYFCAQAFLASFCDDNDILFTFYLNQYEKLNGKKLQEFISYDKIYSNDWYSKVVEFLNSFIAIFELSNDKVELAAELKVIQYKEIGVILGI